MSFVSNLLSAQVSKLLPQFYQLNSEIVVLTQLLLNHARLTHPFHDDST